MKEYSEVKKDFYGDSYVETRDESGRVVQIIKCRTDFYGDETYETYDGNMNYIGYSRLKKDFYGDPYMATYDKNGRLIRTSYEKTDFCGNKYFEIRDVDGKVIGNSTGKQDFLGNRYTETTYEKPAEREAQTSGGGGSGSRSGGGSGGGVGDGIGCIFGIAIFFGLACLFMMLHDADAREKVHRVVMTLSFIVPLALIFLEAYKLRGIGGFFKNRMIVISCAVLLVSQTYYSLYTSLRFTWILESDLTYYLLWFLPFTLFYGYSFLTGVYVREAARVIPVSEIKEVVGRTYELVLISFVIVSALMMLRWEFYISKAVWGRTFIEILTCVAIFAIGAVVAAPGSILFDKMTKSVLGRR